MAAAKNFLIGGVFVAILTAIILAISAATANAEEAADQGGAPGAPAGNASGKLIRTSTGAWNNFGNIRKSPVEYQGEIESPSASFKSFANPVYGLRAIMELLVHYYHEGYTTIREIINHYAPPSDNNPTESYVNYVSGHLDVSPDADVADIIYSENITYLVDAISQFEQGKDLVNERDLNQAYEISSAAA